MVNKNHYKSFACFILALIVMSELSFAQSHGSSCDANNDTCSFNNIRFLECTKIYENHDGVENAFCLCPKDSQYYKDACRKDVGADCENIPGVIQCAPNADCTSGNICKCRKDSGPDFNGNKNRCVLGYNKPCKPDDDFCDETAGFECRTDEFNVSLCICPPTRKVYSEARLKCVSVNQESCQTDDDCTENSICNDRSKCVCLHGYTNSINDGKCYVGFNATCGGSVKTACNPWEKTVCGAGNRCTCKHPSLEVPYNAGTRCRPVAGDPCKDTITDDCFTAETNLRCVNTSLADIPWICLCDRTAVELPDKSCGILPEASKTDFGDSCLTDNNCNGAKHHYCNLTSVAEGYFGQCHCKSGTIREKNECRIPLNGVCTKYTNCIQNSACLEGICRCEFGYRSSGRYCLGTFGFACSTLDQDCRSDQGLICKNAVCNCPEGQEWSEEKSACATLLAGNCIGNPSICWDNSHCTKAGVCDCNVGFSHKPYTEADRERKCLRSYDSSCNDVEDPCNELNFLICGPERKCKCKYPSLQIFDPEEGRCVVGISGGACGAYEENKIGNIQLNLTCHRNAECLMDVEGIAKCFCKADREVEEGLPCPDVRSGAEILQKKIMITFFIITNVLLSFI